MYAIACTLRECGIVLRTCRWIGAKDPGRVEEEHSPRSSRICANEEREYTFRCRGEWALKDQFVHIHSNES